MKKTAGSVSWRIAIAAAATLAAVAAHAVERTYVGTDGKWSTAANWSPTGVPEAGDTAKFTASTTISESFTLPAGVITIYNTVDTLTFSGVISGEGAVVVHQGKTLVLGSANTFTGAFTNLSGNVTAPKLANGGAASSFGAGYGPICFRDGQITVSNTCSTDRHIHYFEGKSWSQFNVQSGKTLTLTGGFHGYMWQRGGGTIKFDCHLDTTVESIGRTDGGAFYFNDPTNTFAVMPTLSNGSFYYCSLSNKNVACSLGAGTALQAGQGSWTTPGYFYYTGSVDVFCDRDIRIYSNAASTYGNYDGPCFSTQNAGVKQTFTGPITLLNAGAGAPFIKFAGVGDGEITASIPHRFHVYKGGSGTWTLSGQNAATGRLEMAAGRIDINGSYAAGATITVANGATLGGTGVVHSAATFSSGAILAPGTAGGCGALAFDGVAPTFNNDSKINIKVGSGTNDVVSFANAPVVNGSVLITLSALDGGAVPEGRYTIMTYGARPTSSFRLSNGNGVITLGDNAMVVTIGMPALVWRGDGVANVWDESTVNWADGAIYSDGDEVLFDDTGSDSPAVQIAAGGVRPGMVLVSAATKNYAFDGGPLAGTMTVSKTGAADLTISNEWTFSGVYSSTAGKTTLAGRFNGPSLFLTGAAAFEQTPTSRISGEDIEVYLGHGATTIAGTNDFTGTVTLDTSAHPTAAASFTYGIYNSRSFGYATNVTMMPKPISGENYNYLKFMKSFEMDKSMTLSVRRSGDMRWPALILDNAATLGGWRGDIRAVGAGTNPGFAFYCYYYSSSVFNVGTLDETVMSGFAEIRCRGNGTLNIYSRLECGENGSLGPNDGTVVNFYATNNLLKTLNISYGRIYTRKNGTFMPSIDVKMGKDSVQWGANHWSELNLNGTTQTVASVTEVSVGRGGWRRITSTLPAMLVVSGAVDCAFGSASAYGNGYIMGAVSLVKDGTSTWTLNGTNSFTGTVTVKGGTLAVNSAKALPETTTLTIGAADGSAGVLKLDKDQTVNYLWIGDKCKVKGVYGGPESSAPRKLSCFSGTATLTILHDKSGTMMILK
jgi:fibronectin-binding autotransporter adhesin